MFINVTPCVGVWIETKLTTKKKPKYWSHPAWVCGLKHNCLNGSLTVTFVTPCVGVWIETQLFEWEFNRDIGHTLRGCVD